MDSTGTSEPLEWRGRYLQALGDLQRSRRRRQDTEDIWLNVVSRLATAALGFDHGMDESLLKIQEVLKSGNLSGDGLWNELDSISAELLFAAVQKSGFADMQAIAGERVANRRGELFETLKCLLQSEQELASLDSLREEFDRRSDGGAFASLAELRSGLREILDDRAPIQRDSQSVRVNLFGRLLRSIRRDYEPVDPAAVKLNLLGLLQAVEMPLVGAAQLDQLRDRLSNDAEAETLAELFGEFARLLADLKGTIQSEHSRFEEFLQDLSGTLLNLEERTAGVLSLAHEYECGSESFRTLVAGHMETLVCISDAASDLQALKQVLRAKVEVMSRYLSTATEVQTNAVRKTAALVDQIAGKLRALDSDVAVLRTRFGSEDGLEYVDALTGLPNRAAFDHRIGQDISRWKRYRLPVFLLLWDVDQLHSVNDRFGHDAGDNVLTVIAEQLQAMTRETDFVARWGGDKFAMILVGADAADALQVCETIRGGVEHCPFHTSANVPVRITVSCGISRLSLGETADGLLARAETAVLQAKQEGGNRCCMCREDSAESTELGESGTSS